MKSFVPAARAMQSTLPTDGWRYCLISYLLDHAVGRQNAKPWRMISAHLESRGHYVSKNTFQQTMLKETRDGVVFIASNDSVKCRGYFLIDDADDAEVMRLWYARRISVERRHLQHLMTLSA